MSTSSCCMCSTTSSNRIFVALTVQLGLGQSAASLNSCWLAGNGRVGLAVICPLRGVMVVVGPSVGPNSACFGGGGLPPLLTHCRSALTSLDVIKTSVAELPSPAALNLAVRVPLLLFEIVGVPMKCGDCAAASIGAISSKADATIAVGIATPLLMLPSILSQLHNAHNVNTQFYTDL
jgi:hypothetical protein